MKHFKSERLKKLETELQDLEQWLKLGLVPKKDVEKHKEEIVTIKSKIEEEKERLQFLKESGETEEYIAPKRPSARAGYTELPTIPDIDVGETAFGFGETAFGGDTEVTEMETTGFHDKEEEGDKTVADDDNAEEEVAEEEESPFSDRNRWRRGGLIDPDADTW